MSLRIAEAMRTDAYFDSTTDLRMRNEDRIELVASFGAERGEHCVVVDEVDKTGKAQVSLLQLYKRSP